MTVVVFRIGSKTGQEILLAEYQRGEMNKSELLAVIAANSYDHYQGHIQQIQAWIDQTQGQG